jgi:hypothetical protein
MYKNFLGCLNKNKQLLNLYHNNVSLSKYYKGWIKQEINRNTANIRNPPGTHLAHERGREKAKGYGYEHSNLQLISNHKLQHKYDNNGKKNKERYYK